MWVWIMAFVFHTWSPSCSASCPPQCLPDWSPSLHYHYQYCHFLWDWCLWQCPGHPTQTEPWYSYWTSANINDNNNIEQVTRRSKVAGEHLCHVRTTQSSEITYHFHNIVRGGVCPMSSEHWLIMAAWHIARQTSDLPLTWPTHTALHTGLSETSARGLTETQQTERVSDKAMPVLTGLARSQFPRNIAIEC